MGIPVLMTQGPASGTYTATPTANRIGVYMYAGGGGATGPGSAGGVGGGGFYNKPITQPFSQPYAVGSGGNGSTDSSPASPGGNTTFTNVGTVNGGAGGPDTTAGNQPGASLTVPLNFREGPVVIATPGTRVLFGFGYGGSGWFPRGECTPGQGYTGGSGALIIYENTGT
jgi:hypothetical protein